MYVVHEGRVIGRARRCFNGHPSIVMFVAHERGLGQYQIGVPLGFWRDTDGVVTLAYCVDLARDATLLPGFQPLIAELPELPAP